MHLIRLYAFVLLLTAFAYGTNEDNTTSKAMKHNKITSLLLERDLIEKELLENNIWSKIYSNYHTYKELKREDLLISAKIAALKKKTKPSKDDLVLLAKEEKKRVTIHGKLKLLEEYKDNPFQKFLAPPLIDDVPSVTNPFAVIGHYRIRRK